MTSDNVVISRALLTKIHRDLDACQKVIWLAGGFDPAYCLDAQECLKQIDPLLAPPAPKKPCAHDYNEFTYGTYCVKCGEPEPSAALAGERLCKGSALLGTACGKCRRCLDAENDLSDQQKP